MRFAEKDGKRIFPNPLTKDAHCPLCKSEVLAKCGKIKVWHWAHKNKTECDSFGESETEWHLNWKNEFPEDTQEIIIGNHRADVKIKDIVIEFQNSRISCEDIQDRENFYGKMKWVLNGKTFCKNMYLREFKGFYKFSWKWFPNTLLSFNREVYIDLSSFSKHLFDSYLTYADRAANEINKGLIISPLSYPYGPGETNEDLAKHYFDLYSLYKSNLFLVKKVYSNGNGWGKFISKEKFIRECLNGYYRN